MKYQGKKLNVLQEIRVVEDFFDEQFNISIGTTAETEKEAWINKRMEDTENEFLMYNEQDIDEAITLQEKILQELKRLKSRDFSTEKFNDSFYYEK